MVKLLKKQSSISLHFENKGSTGGPQRHNEREPGQRHFKQKYQAWPNERQYLSETEDDRTYGGGWMTIWRLVTGGAKAIPEDTQSRQQFVGAISPRKAKKCKSRRWKGLTRAKECMAKRISFPQWSSERDNPICVIFVPLTSEGNIGDVIGWSGARKTNPKTRCA